MALLPANYNPGFKMIFNQYGFKPVHVFFSVGEVTLNYIGTVDRRIITRKLNKVSIESKFPMNYCTAKERAMISPIRFQLRVEYFKGTVKCSFNLYHSPTLTWRRQSKSFPTEDKNPPIRQNHGCWGPGDSMGQGISNQDIHFAEPK